MANDAVKFVDSISASPTTRLDLNDGTTFTLGAAVLAPPPQIRSTVSSNAMTDGGFQSSSRYDYRAVHLELILNVATQDAAATALQNLHRELDRETNFLKWQPDTAAEPVFFKTWRTSPVQIVDQPAARAVYYVTLEIPAEPFALGLRESLGPYTVNNDLAAGSNGGYVDLTGIIGDTPAPLLIHDTSAWRACGLVATRSHDTSSMVWWKQAESLTLGFGTANPGGAADAAMSGSGTTNYARTTFTTTSAVPRISWDLSADVTTAGQRAALPGLYRVCVFLRRSATSASIQVQALYGQYPTRYGPTVTLPATTSRVLVDLGVFELGQDSAIGKTVLGGSSGELLIIRAGYSGAAEAVDWDAVMLVPADESMALWTSSASTTASYDGFLDSENDTYLSLVSAADPFTTYTTEVRAANVSGGFPRVVPGVTNRVFYQAGDVPDFVNAKATTASLGFYYWPRYLHVRPATT